MTAYPDPSCGCPVCEHWGRADHGMRQHVRYHSAFWESPSRWGPHLCRLLGVDAPASWPLPRDYTPPKPLPLSPIIRRRRHRPRRPGANPTAVLLTPSIYVGGAETWMLDLIRTTAGRISWAAVVHLFPRHADPAMAGRLQALAPVLTPDDPKALDALDRADVAVLWGVDVEQAARVLAGVPDDGMAPGVDRRVELPPAVMVSHGVGPWTVQAMRGAGKAAALAAVSPASVATFPESERIRVRVIPNMVDPARLEAREGRGATRARWGVRPDQKALVMVGRLSDEKNPWSIAGAIAELHRIGRTEWVGVHVGTGLGEAEVREAAGRIASGLVRFPGVTDDVAGALLAADVVALPSREEACPMVALEAWAVGAPLIAATVGILTEPRYRSLYQPVPPGCSGRELADAVTLEFALTEGARLARVRHARSVALADFGPERFAREWASIIEAAAGPGQAGPPAFDAPAWKATMAKVNACPFRGCRVGCNKTHCAKFNRAVYVSQCRSCVQADEDRIPA